MKEQCFPNSKLILPYLILKQLSVCNNWQKVFSIFVLKINIWLKDFLVESRIHVSINCPDSEVTKLIQVITQPAPCLTVNSQTYIF